MRSSQSRNLITGLAGALPAQADQKCQDEFSCHIEHAGPGPARGSLAVDGLHT